MQGEALVNNVARRDWEQIARKLARIDNRDLAEINVALDPGSDAAARLAEKARLVTEIHQALCDLIDAQSSARVAVEAEKEALKDRERNLMDRESRCAETEQRQSIWAQRLTEREAAVVRREDAFRSR
jgi:hypothetical protein